MKIGGGQYWKQMQAQKNTYSARMNRAAVERQVASIQHYGSRLFSTGIVKSQMTVQLAFEQAFRNVQARAQERFNALEGLGARIDALRGVDRRV